MTQEELREIIAIDGNYRIELTTSTGDMDKFQEAICAFANDMPGSRKKGYLTSFSVVVKDPGDVSLPLACHPIVSNCSLNNL